MSAASRATGDGDVMRRDDRRLQVASVGCREHQSSDKIFRSPYTHVVETRHIKEWRYAALVAGLKTTIITDLILQPNCLTGTKTIDA